MKEYKIVDTDENFVYLFVTDDINISNDVLHAELTLP